jgi:hypothetical protein
MLVPAWYFYLKKNYRIWEAWSYRSHQFTSKNILIVDLLVEPICKGELASGTHPTKLTGQQKLPRQHAWLPLSLLWNESHLSATASSSAAASTSRSHAKEIEIENRNRDRDRNRNIDIDRDRNRNIDRDRNRNRDRNGNRNRDRNRNYVFNFYCYKLVPELKYRCVHIILDRE